MPRRDRVQRVRSRRVDFRFTRVLAGCIKRPEVQGRQIHRLEVQALQHLAFSGAGGPRLLLRRLSHEESEGGFLHEHGQWHPVTAPEEERIEATSQDSGLWMWRWT